MPLFRRKNTEDNNEKNDKAEKIEKAEQAGQNGAPERPEAPAAEAAAAAPSAPKPEEITAASESVPVTEPAAPRYHTPEGFDFNRYFLAERRVMLENVSYETQRPAAGNGQYRLGAKDTIVAQLIGNAGVKTTYNRTLSFEPEGPFTLSVSFSVMLVFNPGTRGEVDWKTIDVADEFKKNCPQLVQAMMTKAALLIAEITNANGTPILPLAVR